MPSPGHPKTVWPAFSLNSFATLRRARLPTKTCRNGAAWTTVTKLENFSGERRSWAGYKHCQKRPVFPMHRSYAYRPNCCRISVWSAKSCWPIRKASIYTATASRMKLPKNCRRFPPIWPACTSAAAGHSQLGFWPLHVGCERFVLAIAGQPAFNRPQLVELVVHLHRRFAVQQSD